MQSKIPIFFLSILFINLISANLIISPLEVNVQINEPKNYSITIFNNYSFDIYDLRFKELESKGFTFPNMSILKNTSQTYTFTVKTNSSFYGQIDAKTYFNFMIDLPEEITTYTIFLNANGFNPMYKTIRAGDSIRWINNDIVSHDIYSSQFGTRTIESNGSSFYTYTQVGTYTYYDLDYYTYFNEFNGQIEVVNRTETQKAHNPIYDEIWQVTLNSISQPTTLSVTNSQTDYEVQHTKSKKGLLTITNTGNQTAEKIKLTSDKTWITFEKNNFDLNEGDLEGVGYTILPYLFDTNESNKTYQVTFTIKAYNTEQSNITINLFVPYQEISGNLETDFDYAMWLENYWCIKAPCSAQCYPNLPECQTNCSSLSGISTLTANLTTVQLFDALSGIKELKELVTRLVNKEQEFQDKFGITLDEALNLTSSSYELHLKNEKVEKSRTNTIWIIIISSLIILFTLYLLNEENKKRFGKNLLGYKSYKE